jgi:class 3 adenylate cyclase
VGRFYGKSLVIRALEDSDVFGITESSSRSWWRHNVPIMRHDLQPGEARLDEVLGSAAEAAARVEPRAWSSSYEFLPELGLRRTVLGDLTFFDMRINDDDGRFLGVLRFARTALPESLLTRLGRGDRALFERMDRVHEPARRAASILFADLEASGPLSRRLSSRGYFELIGGLTDLIDSSVYRPQWHRRQARRGWRLCALSRTRLRRVGVGGRPDSNRGGARDPRRRHRARPDELDVKVNLGLHWGGTLMVGQVATRGRLEVTALGDAMNEAARIEAVAKAGSILASKELLERLVSDDAAATGIDPDRIDYIPLGELEGAGEKAVRDAAAIPVAEI